MSELNTASHEASKKLVDNEIMLETGAVWVKWYFDGSILSDRNPYEWRLQYKALTQTDFESIPAPCFTEVWMELPWYVLRDDVNCQLQIEKYNTFTSAYYDGTGPNYTSENPTDALIDLLIWVKGQEVV
jgi:hypothetical protein